MNLSRVFSANKGGADMAGHVRVMAIVCAALLSVGGAISCSAQAKQQPPSQVPAPRRLPTEPVQGKISIEPSQQLFATMCAIWASGMNDEINPSTMPPAWANIALQMSNQHGPAAEEVRKYYRDHQTGDRAAMLSRFISLALSAGPPPDFRYTFRHDELPPDVLPIEDFNDVLARFNKEAGLDALWKRMAPAYRPVMDQIEGSVSQIVLRSTGYLREIIKSDSPRTFTVYVEPLTGASMNFRNYGERYEVVLGNAGELPQADLRHAFLHYLLDPLPAKYSSSVTPFRVLFVIAARAPRLPREYRSDIVGLFAECLIKAVELQMDHLSTDQRNKAIDAAEADGYVLVRPLVKQLEKFQESEPANTYYFPDLAKGIDVAG